MSGGGQARLTNLVGLPPGQPLGPRFLGWSLAVVSGMGVKEEGKEPAQVCPPGLLEQPGLLTLF